MGWTKIARGAAAEEYGKRNYQKYAARRSLGRALAVGVAVVVVLAGVVHNHPPSRHATHVVIWAVVVVLVVLALLVVLARVTEGGYRRPRWTRRRY